MILTRRRIRRLSQRGLLCTALIALLGGCVATPLPDLTTPLPAHWRNQPAAATAAKADLQSWWTDFHDARLNALIKQSLQSNLDVAQAVEHLLAARALYQHADAPFRPSLGFRTYHPVDPNAKASYFVIGFESIWELGMFGQRQGALREAQAHMDTATTNVRMARVAVIAEVVRDWIDLCTAQQSVQTLERIHAARQKIVQWEAVRVRLHLAAPAELASARAALATAQAALSAPRQAANGAAQHMALLLGRDEPLATWLKPHALPQLRKQSLTVIPATLLRTRPQIARARAAVLREAGALGIARANMRPDIGLGGSVVWSIHTFTHHGEPSRAIPSLGPTISIPLFDWGLRKARANSQSHQLKASVLAYRQAVLKGVAAVETALGTLAQQRLREQASTQAWHELAQAADNVATRRRLGLVGGIASARSDIAREQALLEVIQARAARDMAYASLYAALGGAPRVPNAASAAVAAVGTAQP